ncbi:MAG: N-acetylmuramoyl-L-alanine amidase family protein, partial [Microcystaceae cyanobacterium]
IVLLPRGGMRGLEGLTSPPGTGNTLSSSGNNLILANNSPGFSNQGGPTIRALDLTRDNRQLVIQADRPLQARSGLNRLTGDYEIRIDNAQLVDNLKGPDMGRNSPISQLKIRQENSNTVVISIQPSAGTRFGNLITGGDGRVALEIMPGVSSGSYPPRYSNNYPAPSYPRNPQSNTGIPLQVDRAPQGSLPPIGSYPPPSNSFPNTSFPRPQRGQRLVFLDAGHGGKDPGAIGLNGVQEKNIILPISQYVGRYLEQQGIRVMQARDSDYFVSLQGRTDMANRAGADLFVSIHANSMGAARPDINGLEVYYFGDRRLSDAIHRNILRTVSVQDRGVRKARFYVLRNSRMPSTLVEVGFVTGYDDAPKLSDVNYQQQMAQAIARGIVEYLQQN